jgi:vacuolar-type H+-ATPase subunit I/STV1
MLLRLSIAVKERVKSVNFDSTVLTFLLGGIGGALASYYALREQDIKHTEAIKSLTDKVSELKADARDIRKELNATEREIRKELIAYSKEFESDLTAIERKFRSLVNFLAGKGLHYKIRDGDKETLS